MKDNRLFVFLTTGEYNNFHRKSFIENFARYVFPDNVLVINRPKDFLITPFKKKFKLKQRKFEKIQKNIYLFTPLLFVYEQLVFNANNYLKKINFEFFRRDYMNITKKLEAKIIIFFTMHPDLNDYLEYTNYNYLLYDMYDEFIVNRAYKGIQDREKYLINKADFTFCISKYLKEKKVSLYENNKISYMQDGVDTLLFKKKFKISEIKIVGYLGNIKDEIDINLIHFLAKNRPDINFQIIGKIPNNSYIKFFSELKNITFLGARKYEELPDIISNFHIGLIPYKVDNEYIKSISPMKLYEYLASNLFVLSTNIPDVSQTKETIVGSKIEIGYSYEDFLNKMNLLLSKPKEEMNENELYSISWENRFDILFKELKERKIFI